MYFHCQLVQLCVVLYWVPDYAAPVLSEELGVTEGE